MSLPRLSIRLTPHQLGVLGELSEALNAPISVIMRAIVLDWLTKNDELIERIIDGTEPFDKDWNLNKNDEENEIHTRVS